MTGKVQLATKKPQVKREISAPQIKKSDHYQELSSHADSILFLQRTVGNRAVERLIRSGTLQAKLRIGQPGDKYEQEADRIAEQVMRMPEPALALKRRCPFAKGPSCKEKKEILQTKEVSGKMTQSSPAAESRINSLRGSGQPLPESVNAFFKPRFGTDFSRVRMHTDAKAVEATRAINAHAFTVGNEMMFGKGQYEPESMPGKKLIAHELTHVMQQDNGVSFKQFPNFNTNDMRKDKIHIQSMGKASVIQRSIIDVTLPDGKMIKADCEAPPPSAPGLAPTPCDLKDLKAPKGTQKKGCEDALKGARADSNVKKIIKNLKNLKGCSVPTMDCMDCTAGCEGAGAWHFPNAIHICADTDPDETEVISYLKHELTHELQDCRGAPDVNCKDRMKMEVEAYKAAGRNFEGSLQGAVWSSCITTRCKDSDINKGLAASMKKYYDSL
jgi:hypothetical protein